MIKRTSKTVITHYIVYVFRLFIFIQAKKRVPVHNTKTYRGGKVQLSFLTSTLDGGK